MRESLDAEFGSVHPNSILGQAIEAGDKLAVEGIRKARKAQNADAGAIEDWAKSDFQTFPAEIPTASRDSLVEEPA